MSCKQSSNIFIFHRLIGLPNQVMKKTNFFRGFLKTNGFLLQLSSLPITDSPSQMWNVWLVSQDNGRDWKPQQQGHCLVFIYELMIFWSYYTPAPRRGRGVFCFTSVCLSVRPSKIFFVPFFSVTVDGRYLIFGHKHHIGIPYCG